MFQNLHLNRLKKLNWLVIAVLMVAALPASPAYAVERDPSVFDTLRADIATLVPEFYQPSFLAKVEAAERLLPPSPCAPPNPCLPPDPCVTPSPCLPPNPCASSNILIALRNENQAVSGTNGYLARDAAIIDAAIAELLNTILPPGPC